MSGMRACPPRVARRPTRGRPRSPRAEEAILEATIALLAEVGLEGTTIQAIADRARVARATIYLRWPTREALIAAALRHAIGREPFPLTGAIEADLRAGAEQAHAILSQRLFVALLPALVREFVKPTHVGITFEALIPNRDRFADEYDRSAASQGFRDDIDGTVVADLVVGASLVQLLATGVPPTDRHREQLVDVVLAGVRCPYSPRAGG
jgi:AcrR family transcriptional regulator